MLKPRLVPALAYLLGATLIVAGLVAIGSYVQTAITVWASADRSLLYWYLFLPLVGAWLVTVGIGFVLLARAARRGGAAALAWTKRSLVVFAMVIAALAVAAHFRIEHNAEAARAYDQNRSLRDDRVRHARKLEQLQLAFPGNDGMTVHARLSDGLDGRYRWSLQVSSNRAVLYARSELLHMHDAAAPLTLEIPFARMFASCFAASPHDAYVCVRNAGTDESYTVQGRLQLVDDGRDAIAADARRFDPVVSTASAGFRLDAFTTGRAVVVKHVESSPP